MASRRSLPPAEVFAELRAGRLRLFDIRRPDEWLLGTPEGAERRDVARLTETEPATGAGREEPGVALLCESGRRSSQAVDRLHELGIEAIDVEGGLQAWREAGLPVVLPTSPLSPAERDRYRRHIALPGFGERGQMALRNSSVLLVGCGGLGSPAALYLAAAGIGRIALIDDDVVERSNLQRQVLHDEPSIGDLKVESAQRRLLALNPEVRVDIHPSRLDASRAEQLVEEFDLVLDGSDNFETRDWVNGACAKTGRPLVYGAVERFAGQVGLFRPGIEGQACYRCLFPEAAAEQDAPNCAEAGVLGVLPGIIGSMQALEAIKWLSAADRDRIPTGWIAIFDGMNTEFRKIVVPRDPHCPVCGVLPLIES